MQNVIKKKNGTHSVNREDLQNKQARYHKSNGKWNIYAIIIKISDHVGNDLDMSALRKRKYK